MPKKSIDDNPITIISSEGTDSSNSDITLISGLDTSVTASEVNSSNNLGGYLGNNVQLNLDDLTADVLEGQPPRLGHGPITFSNGVSTVSHDGRPDWGQAKIVDKAPWTSINKKWAANEEMPHYKLGMQAESTVSQYPKYINEGGVYDTVNLNYRDLNDDSDQSFHDDGEALLQGYEFNDFPVLMQSVPRSSFSYNDPNKIFPYLYQDPYFVDDTTDFFNASTQTSLGLNAGLGTSSLGVRNGQVSVNLGSPFRTTTFPPGISNDLISIGAFNPPSDVGIVVSGVLFPADRGVLALIRFPQSADGTTTSFIGTPATSIADIETRVISAINLGQGLDSGESDGNPGGPIFSIKDDETFPSKITGQYDLYELHTGLYPPESTRSGAVANVTKDTSVGKVRLLRVANAFDGTSTRPGGIPVLFSPYEKVSRSSLSNSISFANFHPTQPEQSLFAYAIDNAGATLAVTLDFGGSQLVIDNPSGQTPYIYYAYVKKEDRNFLSYRMPVLKDYSPSGLKTPTEERDRFFIKRKPNVDQDLPNYKSIFDTAGGYITFGEADNYSFQVARYRQVVTLTRDYLTILGGGLDSGLSIENDQPNHNLGSIALIHFKTERAFEALVRDGIAPSDNDVYSQNLIDYTNINNNAGVELTTSGDDGLDDGVVSYKKENALSVFRPNLNFTQKIKGYPKSITISSEVRTPKLFPVAVENTIKRTNTYFMWASGVIYVNPSSWGSYKGHLNNKGGGAAYAQYDALNNSKFQTNIRIEPKDPQGNDLVSEWSNSKPSTAKPFTTVRPTYQILSSDLSASTNLVADDRWNFNTPDGTNNPVYATQSKRQQVWVDSTDLTHTDEAEYYDISVRPTGDCVKAVTDLSLYDSKQGLCTFTTVGLRPSVMVNKPHKQFENLGVNHIKDDLGLNSASTIKKLLYHSARKLSLLELFGKRLTPNGTLYNANGSAITGIDDIYSIGEITDVWNTNSYSTKDLLGKDYRSNSNFCEIYLQAYWENTEVATQVYNPKTSGQAFSIYRYDDEGYKVYQELDLLPIGGSGNEYALELCSGWDWVDDNDANIATKAQFKYRSDVPVYRVKENNHTRTSATTHWDAKFVGLHEEFYYVECHPSFPYNYSTNASGVPAGAGPVNGHIHTEPKSGIYQLSLSLQASDADLTLRFKHSIDGTVPTIGGYSELRIYKELGKNPGDYDNNAFLFYGEPLPNTFSINGGSATITGTATTFTAEKGATVHLASLFFAMPPRYDTVGSVLTNHAMVNPSNSQSIDENGLRHFDTPIIEVKPTGNRELPEYGNFTMDIKGYITVSGMGSSNSHVDLYPSMSTVYKQPLVSLFTPRKDTQERFLDESYRIEHSLRQIFANGGDDFDTSYQFGNHSDVSGANQPANGDTELRDNLVGPGIPNFGSGVNGGYISFPVRDEPVMSHFGFWYEDNIANNYAGWSEEIFRKTSFHGHAGYLRNSLHMKRITITPGGAGDWYEAQVSGFPNMTRNHLSGAEYGTPPRGVLIYPYQDFNGNTATSHGYNLTNSGLGGALNSLLDSETGFFLPNSNAAIPVNANQIDADLTNPTWIDDDLNAGGTAINPPLRYAQPNYSGVDNTYPDVGYLRAFDLNFGKSNERSPQIPYWNKDWVEQTTSGDLVDRLTTSADSKGLIESEEWVRYRKNNDGTTSFSTIKLRLVGVDWDMISYVDPQFPTARRDGTVYTIDSKKYLMRKRVMRVFVKVPGLTTWLDVGVMNGEVGESYRQYTGNPQLADNFQMNVDGATSDKTHRSIDGAGCCVSYKETFLVEEGLVALDLELDVGFVPAFSSLGTPNFQGTMNQTLTMGSHDEFLGEGAKAIWVGNNTRHYGDNYFRSATVNMNKEAPILVKVILSPPEYPSYEVHPSDATALVDRDNLSSLALKIANIYPNGSDEIYDIWPSPNKSYRGHSFPPDDRAPTWARRGLMGIEVLRPDGSNFDRDEVIDRPNFANTNLFGGFYDPTQYMAYLTSMNNGVFYRKSLNEALSYNIKTNKQDYTLTAGAFPSDDSSTLSKKGEG